MDISLLKTFLELHRTRHFGRAAKNLFLTQSAISARLRLLEESLGVQLFTRDRNNIRLTPAGARFLAHAESIVNAWHRALQATALEDESKIPLSIGGQFSLWDTGLQEWMHVLYRQLRDVALQAEAHGYEVLTRRLLDGVLDVAFLFEPPQSAELVVREIGSIRLVMVATRPGLSCGEAVQQPEYVMVDWGTAFAGAHARHFPDMPAPSIRMGLGRMALAFLLECGGAAFLAEQMVNRHIEDGLLHPVADAPIIEREVYVAYAQASARRDAVEQALEYLAGTGLGQASSN